MATYAEIQELVKANHGFTPKTCWIAHVKDLCGLNPRIAPNRISQESRMNPCPDDKIEAIREALKFFKMI